MVQTVVLANHVHGLEDEHIQQVCPAVFADSPHKSRSNHYLYIPTRELLKAIRSVGFVPTEVRQAGCRSQDTFSYTKHMLRFRAEHTLGLLTGEVPEIVLYNAHDGTCSYKVAAGIIRFACFNTHVVGDAIQSIRVFHRGASNDLDALIKATLHIQNQAPYLLDLVNEMKHVHLTSLQQEEFVRQAMLLRFRSMEPAQQATQQEQEKALTIYQPQDFLRPRRRSDLSNDLWTVFNRVQEHLIKGGMRREDEEGKTHFLRPIRNIAQLTRVNTGLWNLAMSWK